MRRCRARPAELAGYAAEYRAAAVLGDREAAARLHGVLSWMDMLHAAGGDSEVGELLVGFARDDRVMAGLRGAV